MAQKIVAVQTAVSSANSVFPTSQVLQVRKPEQQKFSDKSTGLSKTAEQKTNGRVCFTEEVIAALALISFSDVPGLTACIEKNDVTPEGMIKKSRLRGIRVRFFGDLAQIDISISVKAGYSAVAAAKQVQLLVQKNVENMTGLCVSAVNVHVSSIQTEQQTINAPLKEEIT